MEITTASKGVLADVSFSPTLYSGFAGAALGLSGCLIQTIARNPLASPDLLGISQSVTLAVILGLLLSGSGGMQGEWLLATLDAAGVAVLVTLTADC